MGEVTSLPCHSLPPESPLPLKKNALTTNPKLKPNSQTLSTAVNSQTQNGNPKPNHTGPIISSLSNREPSQNPKTHETLQPYITHREHQRLCRHSNLSRIRGPRCRRPENSVSASRDALCHHLISPKKRQQSSPRALAPVKPQKCIPRGEEELEMREMCGVGCERNSSTDASEASDP